MDGMLLLISTEVKKRNIDVQRVYEENLPPISIDREQMKQVFLNILLNAIEATDEGGRVTVQISGFSRKTGDALLRVEIRDTGRGIQEEHLEDVFTPFFTTKDKGSGLGLSISHQIVKEHGGTLSVESHVGVGSSFFVDLPVSRQDREKKVLSEDGLTGPGPPPEAFGGSGRESTGTMILRNGGQKGGKDATRC